VRCVRTGCGRFGWRGGNRRCGFHGRDSYIKSQAPNPKSQRTPNHQLPCSHSQSELTWVLSLRVCFEMLPHSLAPSSTLPYNRFSNDK
jgi:hypothetical protein